MQTSNYLAVSSFSLHSALGPLTIEKRQDDGQLTNLVIEFPRRHSLEEFFELARDRVGVKAIELCEIQFDSATPERIGQLRAALSASGLHLLTLPIDTGNLGEPNDVWRQQDERRILRWFEIARELGARYVRVNAGTPGVEVAEAAMDGLVASLRSLGDKANAMGLRLLIENHGGSSSDPDFLTGLLDKVGPDRLGLLLDLGNFDPLVAVSHARFTNPDVEDTGLDLEPMYANIARLAPVASLVHAKMVDPARDGTPLPDVPRALAILAAAGYNGSISIEWEGQKGDPWERTARVASMVREVFPNLQ